MCARRLPIEGSTLHDVEAMRSRSTVRANIAGGSSAHPHAAYVQQARRAIAYSCHYDHPQRLWSTTSQTPLHNGETTIDCVRRGPRASVSHRRIIEGSQQQPCFVIAAILPGDARAGCETCIGACYIWFGEAPRVNLNHTGLYQG